MEKQVQKRLMSVECPEEATLLQEFLAGSEEAFTAIYDRFYPSLYSLADRYVGGTVAQDVLADTFVKIWQSEKTFNSLRGLGVYLRVMVRNGCLTVLRDQARRIRREEDFSLILNKEHSLDCLEEQRARLLAAIAKLPIKTRQLVEIALMEGKNNAQVARILGIKKDSVRAQKFRAIKILRSMLTSLF